tara:strand:+ start:521 stop:793 length:273 start_codon:yes stop_codon:yes gene_type:complete
MRKVQLKRIIAKVLLSEEKGMTAQEIYGKLTYKDLSKIKNTQHISNIIKSMKGVNKMKNSFGIRYDGSKYPAVSYSIGNIEDIRKIGGLK